MMRLDQAKKHEISEKIFAASKVAIRGGGTKNALRHRHAEEADFVLDMTEFQGVVEYEPSEYTITALAGTSLVSLQQTLRQQGQYLPFDPMWIEQGATVGGTVASGVSGPGRLRYGGLRDFILGIRFWDGVGQDIRGGGKVVKNSAGFDLPKLFVGSCGRLGVLYEVTLKVFPVSSATRTMVCEVASHSDLGHCLEQLTMRPFELDALEFVPAAVTSGAGQLYVRLAGEEQAFDAHQEKIVQLLGRAARVCDSNEAASLWSGMSEARDLGVDDLRIKIPTTLGTLVDLLPWCIERKLRYRVSVAGQQLWLGWPPSQPVAELDNYLSKMNLSALVVQGDPGDVEVASLPALGVVRGEKLSALIKRTLDPKQKFGD
jgi:glycolate oxidase FAD binding subunit